MRTFSRRLALLLTPARLLVLAASACSSTGAPTGETSAPVPESSQDGGTGSDGEAGGDAGPSDGAPDGGPASRAGAIDQTYGTAGRTVLEAIDDFARLSDAALAAGDQVVFTGGWKDTSGALVSYSRLFVARATSSGVVDVSFGQGGRALPGYAEGARYDSGPVAVLPGGRILVAPTGKKAFQMLALTSNGSLDPTFGNDGLASQSAGDDFYTAASRITIGPDGTIARAGRSEITLGYSDAVIQFFTPAGATARPAIRTPGTSIDSRAPDGAWETGDFHAVVLTGSSFLAAGSITIDLPGTSNVLHRILQSAGGTSVPVRGRYLDALSLPGGGVLALGEDHLPAKVVTFMAKLDAQGAPDLTFGDRGRVEIDLACPAQNAALQPDGKVVVTTRCGGSGSGPSGKAELVRFASDGKLDASFGSGGVVVLGFKVARLKALIQSDGKIVVVGMTDGPGGTVPEMRIFLARFLG